jgi:hypothetical protein
MPSSEIRTPDLSRRAAADLRFRPRGHWDQLKRRSTGEKRPVTRDNNNNKIMKIIIIMSLT